MDDSIAQILPSREDEFKERAYWDSFYKTRGERAFEWYIEGDRFARLIDGRLKGVVERDALVLNLGCGTCGWPQAISKKVRILNVDNSEVAVEKAQQLAGESGNELLEYRVEDALVLASVASDSVSLIVDKGLVDALHPRDDKESKTSMRTLASTVDRVLIPDKGQLILVSLLQPHIRSLLEATFFDWHCRLHPDPECPAGAVHLAFILDLERSDRMTDWKALWREADSAVAQRRRRKPVALVRFRVSPRGQAARNKTAVSSLRDRLESLFLKDKAIKYFIGWKEVPSVQPLAFGLVEVRAVAILDTELGGHADDFRIHLANILGANLDDDDSSSTTSSEDDDENAEALSTTHSAEDDLTYVVAPPEILDVSFGST